MLLDREEINAGTSGETIGVERVSTTAIRGHRVSVMRVRSCGCPRTEGDNSARTSPAK